MKPEPVNTASLNSFRIPRQLLIQIRSRKNKTFFRSQNNNKKGQTSQSSTSKQTTTSEKLQKPSSHISLEEDMLCDTSIEGNTHVHFSLSPRSEFCCETLLAAPRPPPPAHLPTPARIHRGADRETTSVGNLGCRILNANPQRHA
eukprot:gene3637-2572_t